MFVCQFAGFDDGFLGRAFVPQVTLQIGNFGSADGFFVDVGNGQAFGGAEISEHGAFGVRRNQNNAAAGGGAFGQRPGKEINAGGADVALEFLSEFVVMDFADESAVGAQRSEAGNGIGRRTSGNLAFGNEVGIDFAGVGRFDQRHAAFGQAAFPEKAVANLGQNVDDGVADADDIIKGGIFVNHFVILNSVAFIRVLICFGQTGKRANKKKTFKQRPFFQKIVPTNGLFVSVRPVGGIFSVEFNPFFVSFVIGSDCFLRAFGNAYAAADAGIGIDNQLSFAFMESVYRADVYAGFAFDASVINNRNHNITPNLVHLNIGSNLAILS